MYTHRNDCRVQHNDVQDTQPSYQDWCQSDNITHYIGGEHIQHSRYTWSCKTTNHFWTSAREGGREGGATGWARVSHGPRKNFGWVSHNAFGPTNNWPVCSLILRKISTIGATRCQLLRLKCTKFAFYWGSAPDPAGRAYSSPQTFSCT